MTAEASERTPCFAEIISKINTLIGAPEEIRTPDPQIRSLLSSNLGNAIEAISIDGRGPDCLTARKLTPGNLRLLQQYRQQKLAGWLENAAAQTGGSGRPGTASAVGQFDLAFARHARRHIARPQQYLPARVGGTHLLDWHMLVRIQPTSITAAVLLPRAALAAQRARSIWRAARASNRADARANNRR